MLDWNRTQNKRKMPWKGVKIPYRIWLSEIILQQTRVEQGVAYYNRFVETFPRLKDLAEAPEEQIYKMWEGLGYYSRCKNLIATAKYLNQFHDGEFPDTYEKLLSLKGIGPYTAAAIASFAFDKPYAVLDGNVFRVLARFFGSEIPINTHDGKKWYAQLAQELLPANESAIYNQAIMDFGATVCKPQNPNCAECVMKSKCIAFRTNQVNSLPVNEKKIKVRTRHFDYFILEFNQQFCVRTRTEKDIWQNLNEFVLIEHDGNLASDVALKDFQKRFHLKKNNYQLLNESPIFSQRLTHQLIKGRFFHILLHKKPLLDETYKWINATEIKKLAFPKMTAHFINEKEGIFKFVRNKVTV